MEYLINLIKLIIFFKVPLLSRVMPSDTFKIYKRGHKLRVDFTLTDFNESVISWTRGDMSLLFNPGAPKSYQTLLLNNKDEVIF